MQFIKIKILKSYISDFSHDVFFVIEMKASIRNDMNVISDRRRDHEFEHMSTRRKTQKRRSNRCRMNAKTWLPSH